jgi:CO/xanthine dehydrogenase FAD-binding subunit
VLDRDELVVAIHIPKLNRDERDFFWKVGTRRAQAISKVVMAVKAKTRGRTIDWIKIGAGSVAPTVVRAYKTEQLIAGQSITEEIISQARLSISNEVAPIDDLRSTANYRRAVAGNMLARLLHELSDSGGAGT